jgi:hypothetical protein
MTLTIDLAPVARHPPYQLEAPTAYFSSTKIQEDLLEPFRREFYNMLHVTIRGTVDGSLVQSATEDFARDKFDDANTLIESWTPTKDKGTELFKQGKDSCLEYWDPVKNDIMDAHEGPTWTRLVKQGDSSLMAKVAELCYTTNLNIVAIGLKWTEEGDRDVMSEIRNAYESMKRSTKEDYWGVEHSWEPSPAQQMKNKFRYTKFMRLWREPTLTPFAVATIYAMARANPNDAAVLDEKRKIETWKRSAGPFDESAFNAMMNGQS